MDTFIQRFLLSTLLVTLLALTILLLKKVCSKHMSIKMHYQIWYFLPGALIIPFFPWDFFKLGAIPEYLTNLVARNKITSLNEERMDGSVLSHAENSDLLRDFSISVHKPTSDFVSHTGMTIWVIGMLILVGWIIYSHYKIQQIKKSASCINDQKVNELLDECKAIVGVRRDIFLRETSLISSPITLGIFKPYILLPIKTRGEFSFNELKYVFLHELNHQKNKDVLVNEIMWIFQMIYWFNPFVWYALKRMKIDRELACDASVLDLIDERGYVEYGYTIIHFANGKYDQNYRQFASGMGGTKKQIKQRIMNIAKYSKDSPLLKWKSKAICTALAIFVLCLSPLTYVAAGSDDVYKFSGGNMIYEDLSDYFAGYTGSFVLYDASEKQYQIYNREKSEQRVSPNSTYKIYSALFALESNVISTNNNEQVWDGNVHPYKEWNKNHNLNTALASSVNWYFQNVDQAVGKKQLQYYFHKIKYGNENLSGPIDQYWMESSLKISPIEQVELLLALKENRFAFKEENIQAVKQALSIEKHEHGQLFGKTGTGTINGQDVNGWFIGFVEKDGHDYYFAVNIQNNGGANGTKAAEIAKHILQDKDIFPH
ncbi:BlaR1 family beta-lactam sensor/signal transducer [Lederbergia sp. NSJ-179]|uniref:BlaR1 family beta-lactam sensor/signal transducer n=1 Tax=Lederbergia sp. NSJ-179 TaxID=2931402 RepID=UPI001FD345AF|nr:BlaR1 family beta-lactam sensor/signal transducer [Lederbergia sp. NSJ-179]MCJ7841445.1 BlaR1 family beta-lactam sensor/signal transducer [Lederbergia sp. NSJ-179]